MVLAYAYAYVKPNQRKFCIIFLVLLFSIVFGLRYDVGTDFPNYWRMLEGDNGDKSSVEYLFGIFNYFVSKSGMFPSVGFMVYAFIQIFFFVKAIKAYPKIFIWALFFYFTSTYIFLSLNVVRQTMAFSILLWSTWFIYKKEFVPYLITVLLATGIHASAIIFLPLYFLLDKELFRKKTYQIILLTIAFVAGPAIQKILWMLVPFFGSYVLGVDYSDTDISQFEDVDWNEKGAGLGYILWYLIDSLIICSYDSIKRFFNHRIFVIWYNLYFIGAILSFLVGATYLSRINVYFDSVKIVIYGVWCAFLYYTNSKYHIKGIVLILFILIMIAFYYVAIMKKASNCAPFQFV